MAELRGDKSQALLCMASDADGTTFRVCRNETEAMAFYKEMWGEDLGGGIQSQIDHFRDEDNWSHGLTEYHCELYCSNFRVWRVDLDELSIPSHVAQINGSLGSGTSQEVVSPSTPSTTPRSGFQDQTRFYDAKTYANGNCMQAAIASTLNMPLAFVPDFRLMPNGEWGGDAMRSWLGLIGYDCKGGFEEDAPKDQHYIANGPAARGTRHSCVYLNGALAFDPHPSRTGLESVDSVWWFPIACMPSAIAPNDHIADAGKKVLSALLDRNITYDGRSAVLPFESHDQAINHIGEARRACGLLGKTQHPLEYRRNNATDGGKA